MGTMVALATLALPNGDDFCRARLLPLISAVAGWHTASSPFGYVADSWMHWTGRWLAMLIETTVLAAVDITRAYAVAVLCVWGVLLAALAFACRELLALAPRSRTIVASTLVFWVLYWQGIPGPGDGLFWFTGAVENLLPVALGCLVVALLSRSARTTGTSSNVLRVAAAAGALAVPGLHELHGLSLCLALALGAFLAARSERGRPGPWLFCAALAFAGAGIVIVAPGNRVRAGFLPHPNVLVAARLTLSQLVRYLPVWALGVPLLAATTAFVFHPAIRAARPAWVEEYFGGGRMMLVPAVTLALVVVGFLGPSYALSSPAPTRTVSGVYLVYLVGWFVTVFVATRGAPPVIGKAPQLANALTAAALLVFAGSVVTGGNTRTGIGDLRHTARAWHASMTSRYRTLRAAPSRDTTVLLARATRPPSVFFGADIEERPSAWRNECVAGYFGVRAVALVPRAAPDDATTGTATTGTATTGTPTTDAAPPPR